MTIMLIDNPVDTATVTASSEAALLPAANVKDPARSKFWRSGAGTKSWLDITFGAEEARTYAALVDLNLTSGGTIRLQSWGAALGVGHIRSQEGIAATFTRANATASRFDKYGDLESPMAANAPRVDYNPLTLAVKGLYAEGPATNVVIHCRDLTNAAWVKTNATAVKDQTGIDRVANSASKLTATAANATALQTITLASSARMQSTYIKRVTGSGVIEMTQDNGLTWTAVTVTAGWTRVKIAEQTLANPVVGFRIVTSGDAIALDGVQNEDSRGTPTSVIMTAATALSRGADTPSYAPADIPGLVSTTGTVCIDAESTVTDAGNPRFVGSNTAATGLITAISNSPGQASTWNGAVSLTTPISTSRWDDVGGSRAVLAWSPAGRTLAMKNAASVTTDANTVGAINAFLLGHGTGGGNPLQGHIRRFRVFTTRLSDADAQTLADGGSISATPALDAVFTTDLGADITVNPSLYSAAVGQANYGGGAFGQGNYGSTVAESQLDSRNLTIVPFGRSYLDKFWRVTFTDTNTSYQECARVYITTPVEFTYNISWGWRLSREDRSAAKESIGGQRYVQERDSRLRVSGDFDYLSDAERTSMAVRMFEIGENTPIIFSIYPEATTRGLTTTGYGRLVDASLSHSSHEINHFPFTFLEEL